MRSYVMLFPWMSVIFCWGGRGNMIEIFSMTEERTHTPWRRMVGHICCCQLKTKRLKKKQAILYFS
jgi:hypothetical protein